MNYIGKSRAIIFAHFDKDGLLDRHVQFLLMSLRKYCTTLIFVSTSILPEELKKAALICDTAICRENVGYDFVSWKVGLESLTDVSSYDEITFINDSCYGPVFGLDRVFEMAAATSCDIWGLIYNYEFSPHLQSFFFSFRKNVIAGPGFSSFWDAVVSLADKNEIIRRYELGMTKFFEERGYRVCGLFDTKSCRFSERFLAAFLYGWGENRKFIRMFKIAFFAKKPRGLMHFYWRAVLGRGIPFIKVELLRDNPQGVNLRMVGQYLKRCKGYDSEMIFRHLDRIRNN